ncbi:unnamed protein product, partial [Durusdinium trenchii]
ATQATQAMAFVSLQSDFRDPKSHLTHFCHRYCQRPIVHGDVEYFTYELSEQFQAVVILHCMKGNAFPGRVSSNQKEAEWSAAEQALKAFTSLTEMVLLPEVKEMLRSKHQVRSRWQMAAVPEMRRQLP